jgi:hypothetical protein
MNAHFVKPLAAGIRFAALTSLLASICVAQSTPPACLAHKPADGGGAVTANRPPARPTAQEIKATAEAGAADPSVLLAAEPLENFGAERYRIADYADCTGGGGCYWADFDAQATRAEAALKVALGQQKPGDRLALVLDIDETSLSSYCEMAREDYGYVKPMFESWIVSPEASIPLLGTLRLFRTARAAGVAVFFITGRPEEQRAATAANLKSAGYEGWTDLRLREGAEKAMSATAYKSGERQKIVDAGYRLIMNVGDQWSDLNGSPKAMINVKLPNPFYYLP